MDFFVEDHKRLASLFKYLGQNDSLIQIRDIIQAFQRHIKKEELLYSKYKHETGEIIASINTIRTEHVQILKMLGGLEKKFNETALKELIALLERHKNVEERLLYPKLDEVLSAEDKDEVYRRII